MHKKNKLQNFSKTLACVLFAIFLNASATAQLAGNAIKFQDITISPEPPMEGESIHGYVEFRFFVRNSGEKSHKITLNFPHPRSSYGQSNHYIAGLSRTVEVAPMSSATISLFQPALQIGGSEVEVIIDGNRQNGALACNSSHPAYYSYDSPILVLLSRECQGEFFVRDPYRYSSTPAPVPSSKFEFPSSFKFQRSVSSVSLWSEHWLGYSRYDAIVISAAEMDRLSPGACDALGSYIQCGGILLILGQWKLPDYWRAGEKNPLEKCFSSYQIGFGHCMMSEEEKIDDFSYNQLDCLKTQIGDLNQVWRRISGISAADANRRFQVAEDIGIPIRGMFLLLLVFTIVIGPVNFIILKRRNKRIWFLVTVPLISIIACVMIFGYSALATGWKKYARSETVTILDEGNQRATTIGWVGYYSATTPGKGLGFSARTELSPLIHNGRVSTARYIDWSVGQQLTSGWVAARVPAHFVLRKSETRRERVTVKKQADGRLVAINGLGAAIEELNVADESGKIHRARNIAPGQRVILETTGEPCAIEDPIYLAFGLLPDASIARNFARWPSRYLRAGTYIAVLSSAPFIEKGLKEVDSRNDRCVVFGYMKGIEDES